MKIGLNDIGNTDYHADTEYLSSSSLKMMLKEPKDFYKKYVLNEKVANKESAAMTFGSYIHSLILEPHLVAEEYAVFPGIKRGKAWEQFKMDNPGKTFISPLQRDSGKELMEAFNRFDEAVNLCTDGTPEQTLCVELEGIKIKVRCDYLKNDTIVDVKTTFDGVMMNEVQNTCVKWQYDLSAALYADAFTKHTGRKHDFVFVFINKNPLDVEIFKASEQFLENGRRKYRHAIEKIKQARDTGNYFSKDMRELSIPEVGLWHL